mgnify:CR=1 FL=1
MPYAPPSTFVAGTAWLGSELDGNFIAARDYLNATIVVADYGARAFDTRHITEGMPALSWDDHAFESGGHYLSALITDDTTQRRYSTGTLKNSDITQQVLYQQIPGSSLRLWMDAGGDVWIEGYGYVECPTYVSDHAYTVKTTPSPLLVDSRLYLEVDGVVIANTRNYAFCENSGSPTSQSIATGMGSAFANLNDARRPLYFYWVATGLSAGWHTIRLVTDTRSEILFIGEDSWQWEVLSDCGLTSYTGTDYLSP